MKKPLQIEEDKVDLTALKEICQSYIDFVDNDEEYHEDNDYSHYIFETTMEALFGKGVWNFINNRRD